MKSSFSEAKVIYETDNSIGKLLLSSEELDIVHLTVSSNSQIDSHSIPQPIFFFVIEGSGIIEINGKEFFLNQNDMISVEPELQRSWTNNSNSALKLLGIKQK